MDRDNIYLIGKYELKLLFRDRSFRIVSGIGLLLVFLLEILTHSRWVNPVWIAVSLPSAISYANGWLSVLFNACLSAFFCGNFLEQKMLEGTGSALWVRRCSNIEILAGKSGAFFLFMILSDAFLCGMGLFVHLFLSDSPFSFFPYVFYSVTLIFPGLLFFMGLSLCVKGLSPHPGVSRLFLLGLLSFFLSFGSSTPGGVLDLMAESLPNAFSDVTGFSGLGSYLFQRMGFLFSGFGLLLFSVTFMKRPSDGAGGNLKTGRWGIVPLGLGLCFWSLFLCGYFSVLSSRSSVRDVFVKYRSAGKAEVLSHDIRFSLDGDRYRASSRLLLCNGRAEHLDSLVLYLNPGLYVSRLQTDGRDVDYRREKQVLVISEPLAAGDSLELNLDYGGRLDASVCYPEIVDVDSVADVYRSFYIYTMGRDYFYLGSDYTLLTPECLWYPVSKPVVDVESPWNHVQDYTRFRLSVSGTGKRAVISQGRRSMSGDTVCFENRLPLQGLTLCAGDYIHKSMEVDGMEHGLYLLNGHEYLFPKMVTHDDYVNFWEGINRHEEEEYYVFDKLCLVEVPVHFCAYSRYWRINSELVQPELLLRPEREAASMWAVIYDRDYCNITPGRDFLNEYLMARIAYEKRDRPLGNLFFRFMYSNGQDVKNEGYDGLLWLPFHYGVWSPEFEGVDVLFRAMQKGIYGRMDNFEPGIERLKELQGRNLYELIKIPGFAVELWLGMYGYELLKRVLCRVPHEDLKRFNSEFLRGHTWRNFSYEEYCEAFEVKFGFSLLELTRNIYDRRGLPSFYFRDVRLQKVYLGGEETGRMFSVKVWNRGNQDGVLTLSGVKWYDYYYHFPAGACKEIRIYLPDSYDNTFSMNVLCGLAWNGPSQLHWEFPVRGSVGEDKEGFFDTDTLAFAPEEGVYIVDDQDEGFHILENNRWAGKLRKTIRNSSETWKFYSDASGYGEPISGSTEKYSCSVQIDVEWETELEESGTYEIFIYNDKWNIEQLFKNSNNRRRGKVYPVQCYCFIHADGEEEIEIYPMRESEGWVSLGDYYYEAGKAKITLVGKGVDEYQGLCADAVKWVRVQ